MLAMIVVAILAAVLGVALGFVGYRFFLVMLPIWGFFAGLWLGGYAVSLMFGGGFLASVTGLVVGVVVGLIAAVLSYLLYMVGVFIIAAGFGAALGSGLMSVIGLETGLIYVVVTIVFALVIALLTLALDVQKYVLMLITAVTGASLMILSVLLVFGQVTVADLQSGQNVIRPVLQESWFWLIVWGGLLIAGVVIQIASSRDYTFSSDRYVEGWG